MTLRIPRLDINIPIVQPGGHPTQAFLTFYNGAMRSLETAFNALEDAINAIEAAQAAADAANEAAAAADAAATAAQDAASDVNSAGSLANSYVTNFTPPVVQADSSGNVTIANHDRVYGDGSTVSITGGVVATGQANPTVVYIFYSDTTRADTTPTFQYSTNEADAAQIGDVHNVGAVTIPAAGTQSGGYARPPGFGGIQP